MTLFIAHCSLSAIFVAGLLIVLSSSLPAQNKRPMELEDLFRIKRVSDPQLSPDGKWVGTWEGTSVMVRPLDGGTPKLICPICGTAGSEDRGVTPPMVSWSPDQKFVYLHFPIPSRQTFAFALKPGQIVPPLPASGIRPKDAGGVAGARLVPQQRASVGSNPSIYVFPRVSTQRNIYRVSVP